MKKLPVMLLATLSFAVLNSAPGSAGSVLNKPATIAPPKLAAPPPASSLIRPGVANNGGSLINNGGSTLINRNGSGIVAQGAGNFGGRR